MKIVLVKKKYPECRGYSLLPGMRCRWSQAWTGSGIVHKGRVKVRPQGAAVHPTHPSTRLEVRLPRSKEKCMVLGRCLLGTLVPGLEGLV